MEKSVFMRNFVFLLFALSMNLSSSFAMKAEEDQLYQFHDINSLTEVNRYLKPGQSLIVWDLDNTVFTPDVDSFAEGTKERELAEKATDGSYYTTKNHYKNDLHFTPEAAYRKAVDEWNEAVQLGARVRPVEPGITLEWIKARQDEGYKMIAVTARELSLAPETRSTLEHFGIDFTRNGLFAAGRFEFQIDGELFPEPALWENEIFYVGRGGVVKHAADNHKGNRFVRLMNELKIEPPKHVVFIDDRGDPHVTGMIKALKDAGIPIDGFAYHAIEPVSEK